MSDKTYGDKEPKLNLDDYFSQRRAQREGRLPTNDEMDRFFRIDKQLRGVDKDLVSKADKIFHGKFKTKNRTLLKVIKSGDGPKVDDVEPMMDGGMVMPKKKKKAKAKKMMGGGKVYSRGSRKANYNG